MIVVLGLRALRGSVSAYLRREVAAIETAQTTANHAVETTVSNRTGSRDREAVRRLPALALLRRTSQLSRPDDERGASATVFRLGIWPKRVAALEVRGRSTGRTISFPVVIADLDGERYLVSMLGENTNWVRNVRAADGRAVLRHGVREVVQLDDVASTDRAPILHRYMIMR